ncbi:MAG: glycosyltransferase [Chloroflexi bacterium]|nr:glycosyltransferase [Chloroflexota bacterium]
MAFAPRISILTSLYRAAEYLPQFLDEVQAQTIFDVCELVLVLNDPEDEEEKLAADFQRKYANQVKRLRVSPVETLGASWNRAWQAATAPYLAIWNVDDRRLADSLERQAAALEAHPDWQLCYGDYLLVAHYGDDLGQRRHTPRYSPRFFRRAQPQGGAFWLFRAGLSAELGYFDEQLRVGPDFDYSARLASRGLRMGRVKGILGYFTDAAQGLSTREGAQPSAIDRTAIQLRYGVYDKVRPEHLEVARRYRLDAVLSFGEWQPLETYLPGYARTLHLRRPLWLLGWLRNKARALLRRLGILDGLYALQRRYLKREL